MREGPRWWAGEAPPGALPWRHSAAPPPLVLPLRLCHTPCGLFNPPTPPGHCTAAAVPWGQHGQGKRCRGHVGEVAHMLFTLSLFTPSYLTCTACSRPPFHAVLCCAGAQP